MLRASNVKIYINPIRNCSILRSFPSRINVSNPVCDCSIIYDRVMYVPVYDSIHALIVHMKEYQLFIVFVNG